MKMNKILKISKINLPKMAQMDLNAINHCLQEIHYL